MQYLTVYARNCIQCVTLGREGLMLVPLFADQVGQPRGDEALTTARILNC